MQRKSTPRQSTHRAEGRTNNVQQQLDSALAKIRTRAEKILGPSTRVRSFEHIYEELAKKGTRDAILLRNAIAKMYHA